MASVSRLGASTGTSKCQTNVSWRHIIKQSNRNDVRARLSIWCKDAVYREQESPAGNELQQALQALNVFVGQQWSDEQGMTLQLWLSTVEQIPKRCSDELTWISWEKSVCINLLTGYWNKCINRLFCAAAGDRCSIRSINHCFQTTFLLRLAKCFEVNLNKADWPQRRGPVRTPTGLPVNH